MEQDAGLELLVATLEGIGLDDKTATIYAILAFGVTLLLSLVAVWLFVCVLNLLSALFRELWFGESLALITAILEVAL